MPAQPAWGSFLAGWRRNQFQARGSSSPARLLRSKSVRASSELGPGALLARVSRGAGPHRKASLRAAIRTSKEVVGADWSADSRGSRRMRYRTDQESPFAASLGNAYPWDDTSRCGSSPGLVCREIRRPLR